LLARDGRTLYDKQIRPFMQSGLRQNLTGTKTDFELRYAIVN
jgi:hypothetical protein